MYAAGILPIAWINGEAYFLLGKDARDGTWSDFAGRSETSDQDIAATAAREFWEETHGLVVSEPRVMRARLPGNSVVLESRTQNGLPFWCYVVEVPWLPWLRNTFLKTVYFLKKNRAAPRVYVEKLDVCYFRWDELGALPKRGVFRATIDQHRETLETIVRAGPENWRKMCSVKSGTRSGSQNIFGAILNGAE